jgi:hypothetical protein
MKVYGSDGEPVQGDPSSDIQEEREDEQRDERRKEPDILDKLMGDVE